MVSIVIPLYNNEDKIAVCLNSLLDQDYHDLEIIVVDDGSDDHSYIRAQEFKSEKIKVITKSNGGPASARNYGITHCNQDSKWIMFVDSDDTVAPNFVSTMTKYASPNTLPICEIAHIHESDNYSLSKQTIKAITEYKNFWNNESFLNLMRYGLLNSTCNKIYSLDLLRKYDLRFKTTYPEDLSFNLEYINHLDRICFVKSKLYNYIHSNNSVTTRGYVDLYLNYIKIQHQLYSLVPKRLHNYVNEFVYPQYFNNTKAFINTGDFNTPKQYLKHPDISIAINSHKSTGIGDFIAKLLIKYRLLKLLSYL